MQGMTSKIFQNIYKKKGWSPKELGDRWGYTTSRIYQLADEVESGHPLSQGHIDRANGLPDNWD